MSDDEIGYLSPEDILNSYNSETKELIEEENIWNHVWGRDSWSRESWGREWGRDWGKDSWSRSL